MSQRSHVPLRSAPGHPPAPRPNLVVRAGLAVLLTAPVVATGMAATSDDGIDAADDTARSALTAATGTADGAAGVSDPALLADRAERVSRSADRVRRPVTMEPRAVDRLWATAPLNVWTGPGERTERVGLVKKGTELAATGQRVDGYAEVLLGDKERVRWVNARYLSDDKPQPKRAARRGSSSATSSSTGLSTAPCPDGSSVEAGLTPAAVRAYRVVCNAFPTLTTYGGLDPHGEHYDGRAVDFMTTAPTGDAIAGYLRANAAALNVRNIIWAQRIWSSDRAGEGWRSMSDRGSTTANHFDHVHVSVH
jgi:uncharacterized protein YgiM (DUF1202 family)